MIDSVRFDLWTPEDEEREFHPMIKEHSRDIFGSNSFYFDVRHKLKSKSGIGSIPDAYVITLGNQPEWYVVENELSTHPVYDHIVMQLTKFMSGLKNPETLSQILEAVDGEIRNSSSLKTQIEEAIGSGEIYRTIAKLFATSPVIVVVIDQLTEEVKEACENLKYETRFVEFKTYVNRNNEKSHIHMFEPIYEKRIADQQDRRSAAANKAWGTRKSQQRIPVEELLARISNANAREMAIKLRDEIKRVSTDITEGTSLDHVNFFVGSKFSSIYPEKTGFCLEVRIPFRQFNMASLDISEHKTASDWTFIHVNEKTDFGNLLDAAKQAYERHRKK